MTETLSWFGSFVPAIANAESEVSPRAMNVHVAHLILR